MLIEEPARVSVRFGAFEANLRAGELRKHGYKIKLQQQPFRLLEVLLRNSGQVVTRDELQRQIWPADTFVDFERGLNNAVKRLRNALGDSAEAPRYVETVARRGYRFVAAVDSPVLSPDAATSSQDAVPPSASPRAKTRFAWLTAAAVLLLLVVGLQLRRQIRSELDPVSRFTPVMAFASLPENLVDYAAISPDGEYIAFTDASGIHIRDLQTGETRTIPPPGDPRKGPGGQAAISGDGARFPISWYPDGTRLLVSTGTQRSASPGPTIWAVSTLTGNAQRLYDGAWASGISPDGSTIAAISKESEIWLMGSRGESPRLLLTAGEGKEIGRASWSPDGRRLAYLHVDESPERLNCSLENVSVTDPKPVVILSDPRVCYPQAQSIWWLSDGRLVFPDAERNFNFRNFNLWQIRVDLASGKPLNSPERLTNWPGSGLQGITASANGKRLAFTRVWYHTSISLADIDPSSPGSIANSRTLAADVDGDWPTTWTDDGRAVVFYSVKNGDNDIFEQELDSESSRPLVTGPGEQLAAILSPDGRSFIYMEVPRFESFGLPNPVHLMRVSVTGGPSQELLTSEGYRSHQCSRGLSNICILGEERADGRITLSRFDSAVVSGSVARGEVIATLDPGTAWAISPDGSRIVTSTPILSDIRLHFISLQGADESDIEISNWPSITSFHWAPDGRSLFIASRSPSGCNLLQVDLRGTVHVLSRQAGAFQMWALPSPDGRRLAVFSAVLSSEIWTAENF